MFQFNLQAFRADNQRLMRHVEAVNKLFGLENDPKEKRVQEKFVKMTDAAENYFLIVSRLSKEVHKISRDFQDVKTDVLLLSEHVPELVQQEHPLLKELLATHHKMKSFKDTLQIQDETFELVAHDNEKSVELIYQGSAGQILRVFKENKKIYAELD